MATSLLFDRRTLATLLILGFSVVPAACGTKVSGKGNGDGDGDGDAATGGAGGARGDGDGDGLGGAPGNTGGNTMVQGPVETSRSGTRLARRFLESSGGGRFFIDFWDQDLDVACAFREAADGSQRCLVHPRFTGDVYYFSDTCSDALLSSEATCGAEWGEESDTGAIYRKTEQTVSVPGDNLGYYRGSGTCNAVYVSSDAEYFETELVPAGAFLRGQFQTVEREDGFGVRLIEGDDGSQVYVDVVHSDEGYTCAFDDQGYCLPANGYEPDARHYEDAACSNPIHGFDHSNVYLIGVVPWYNRCASMEYFEPVPAEAPTTAYYRNAAGDCVSTTSTGYNYFTEGAQILRSELPRAEVELLGDGPLRARRFVDSAGEPLTEVVDFWDTTTDQPCTPFEKTEGGYVCIPKNYASIDANEHLDSNCTDADQRSYAICPPGKPNVAVRVGEPFFSCSIPKVYTIDAAYEVGESVGLDYYFENEFVECEMRPSFDWYSAYQTGADKMESLVELSLTTAE